MTGTVPLDRLVSTNDPEGDPFVFECVLRPNTRRRVNLDLPGAGAASADGTITLSNRTIETWGVLHLWMVKRILEIWLMIGTGKPAAK